VRVRGDNFLTFYFGDGSTTAKKQKVIPAVHPSFSLGSRQAFPAATFTASL
jgi:hypothetical protein